MPGASHVEEAAVLVVDLERLFPLEQAEIHVAAFGASIAAVHLAADVHPLRSAGRNTKPAFAADVGVLHFAVAPSTAVESRRPSRPERDIQRV